jgi:hypothetical protein
MKIVHQCHWQALSFSNFAELFLSTDTLRVFSSIRKSVLHCEHLFCVMRSGVGIVCILIPIYTGCAVTWFSDAGTCFSSEVYLNLCFMIVIAFLLIRVVFQLDRFVCFLSRCKHTHIYHLRGRANLLQLLPPLWLTRACPHLHVCLRHRERERKRKRERKGEKCNTQDLGSSLFFVS